MYDIELEPDPIRRIVNYRKLFDILRVSMDLDICTYISSPLTAHRLSRSIKVEERFLAYLLETLRRIGLVERTEDADGSSAYQSAPVARQYLSRESPLYLGRERFHNGETGKLLERYIKEGRSGELINEDY